MKLYYATGTCSMSCVIGAKELGIDCELIEVSWKTNKNVDELNRLNPLGTTPVLVLDDGKTLTQNAAILEFFGDKKPDAKAISPAGTWERAQITSWLSFVAADFHKSFGPIFSVESMAKSETAQKEILEFTKKNITNYVHHIEHSLRGHDYIVGNHFTVADCYLYTILTWCDWAEISLADSKSISAYMKRMAERPGVKKAMELE